MVDRMSLGVVTKTSVFADVVPFLRLQFVWKELREGEHDPLVGMVAGDPGCGQTVHGGQQGYPEELQKINGR